MTLKRELEHTGNILFRLRSYLPLFLAGLAAIAARNIHYPFGSHRLDLVWELFCLLIAFFGIGIRFYTAGHIPKGTSGRNTHRQKASTLNTTGIYSVVRHPLYLGNFVIWLGVALSVRNIWFCMVVVLAFWLYYERIIYAEEEFLERRFGQRFLQWARRTPAFIPRWRNWRRPDLPFSFRTALKREYHGLPAVVLIFTGLDIIEDLFVKGRLELDPLWGFLSAAGGAFYLAVRFMAKRTKWLHVEGR